MLRRVGMIAALIGLTGCVNTAVMPLSADTFEVVATSDDACGRGGTQGAAVQQAAIETLRRGYDRFLIVGRDGHSAQSLAGFTPITTHRTTGKNGKVKEITFGGDPIMMETHEAVLLVQVLDSGHPEAARALSARGVLGPDWQKAVSRGRVDSCF